MITNASPVPPSPTTRPSRRLRVGGGWSVLAALLLAVAACGSGSAATDAVTAASTNAAAATAVPIPTAVPTTAPVDDASASPDDTATEADSVDTGADGETVAGVTSTFKVEVWADNWFALHVNGALVLEDSVPITTERSFNSETATFEATYPLTLAIEAKDFKETDSGIEYIGERNQQMGDGGLIAQITDLATGEVVAVTDAGWQSLVIHRAPLNKDCEGDADPDATCLFESVAAPDGWTAPDFDTATWMPATVWSAADVDPKLGYDEISWQPSAQLIWGTDLETDNTVLFRTVVAK